MRKESAVLLNSKTINISDIGRGGISELTTQDLLGALSYGGTCDKHYRALSVFTGCADDIQRLADPYLLAEAADIALRDKWQFEKGDLLMLCKLAATELYDKRSTEAARQSIDFKHYRRYYDQIYACALDLANEAMRRAIKAFDDRDIS